MTTARASLSSSGRIGLGVVPVMDDLVALHFGDDNEEERLYSVRLRVIDGTRPDLIKLYIR